MLDIVEMDEIVEMVMKVRLKIVILLLSSLPAGKL